MEDFVFLFLFVVVVVEGVGEDVEDLGFVVGFWLEGVEEVKCFEDGVLD